MDEIAYWVWFQQAFKFGSGKIKTINLICGSVKDFYNAGSCEWRNLGCFTNSEIANLNKSSMDEACKTIEKCSKLGYQILVFCDKEYPERLKNISNPPIVLYVKGEFPEIDKKLSIAIVGTRKATVYGVQMAFELAFDLSKKDAIIVSGGAVGIDRAAHKGALEASGKTIAVLGCGINVNYLYENSKLRQTISERGAVISEFPPDYPVVNYNFPIRNRIISGLSLGSVIIEAGEKSGSLITANAALEQNRDVFVVPVDMRTNVSKGTVALIRDGAKIVTSAEDILREYSEYHGFTCNNKNNKNAEVLDYNQIDFGQTQQKKLKINEQNCDQKNLIKKLDKKINLETLSEIEKVVYNLLSATKLHVDEICEKTNLRSHVVLQAVTKLEINGLIVSHSGRVYSSKK